MSKVGGLREAAIAKAYEARALAESQPTLNAEQQRRYDGLMAEFKELDRQFRAELEKIEDASTDGDDGQPRAGGIHGMPFPSGNGAHGAGHPGRASIHKASWGAQVVDAIDDRAGGSRVFAGVLNSGSIPVTVPLNSRPVIEARRVRFLRELIPSENAPGGRFSYLRQSTRTNNAAVVAEGARKPTSIYTLTRIDDRTRVIAHLSEPIPRLTLDDAGLLRTFIDDELRYGIDLALDAEALLGDGTGEHMDGLLNVAGTQDQAWATDRLTTTRKAVTKLETVDLEPTGFVLNPTDWEGIELEAKEQFAANPQTSPTDSLLRRLHGIPVLVSNAITAGRGLLGAFLESAVLYQTDGVRIDWSEAVYDPDAFGVADGASDFERNMVRFRAEGRWNIAVTRPLGFVDIDLTAA